MAEEKDSKDAELEKEIRDFLTKKLKDKKYVFTVSYTEGEKDKIHYKVFYGTNADGSKDSYSTVYPLANVTSQLFEGVLLRFYPAPRRSIKQ
ncbi:hypothetical protein HY990_07045 [Candidatus Micrarchaeota archaeon]|nr:hypothetical protein [Candidatus Micrarchaeota archaeon]